MFISYDFVGKSLFKQGHLKFIINDSDFQETVASLSIWHAIIETYEKRKLNVPKNLALCFIFYTKFAQYYSYDIMDYIKTNCSEYEEEMKKYLILL